MTKYFNKNLILILMLSFSTGIFSQDTIVLRSGLTIDALVLDSSLKKISYKRSDNLRGAMLIIKTKKVDYIKRRSIITSSSQVKSNSWLLEQTPDTILLKSGYLILAERIKVGSKKIFYYRHDNPNGGKYSLATEKIDKIKYGSQIDGSINNQDSTNYQNAFFRNSFGLSFGFSSAVFDFGDKSSLNNFAGHASSGFNIYLNYGFLFTENVGFELKWYGNSNEFDPTYFEQELKRLSNYEWKSNTSFWSGGGILIGPALHPKLSDEVSLDFRFLAGYTWLISPDITLTSNQFNIELASSTSASVGFNFGTGFTIKLGTRARLKIGIDYLYGSYVFNRVKTTYSNGYGVVQQNLSQNFSVINGTIGFAINF